MNEKQGFSLNGYLMALVVLPILEVAAVLGVTRVPGPLTVVALVVVSPALAGVASAE